MKKACSFFFLRFLILTSTVVAQSVENPVVPSAVLGEFRHGTYPSLGNRTHLGIDLVSPCGSNIYAFADGVVKDVISSATDPNFNSLGYMVLVEHSAALNGKAFYTLYLHMQEPPLVDTGDEVEGGQNPLGKVGDTGVAFSCHTHFEIRYFPDRFSAWGNIYGDGDQRSSNYFRQNWENPMVWFHRYPRGITQAEQDASRLGQELIQAALEGDEDRVRELLDSGANVNFEDHSGQNALEWAARGKYNDETLSFQINSGHIEVVKILIQAGADVSTGDALSDAVFSGHVEVVRILLNAEADARNEHLVMALRMGHSDIVELLLDAGSELIADPTTLSAAAGGGFTEIVRSLVEKGVDVNANSGLGWGSGMALMAAASGGHIEIVKELLLRGANVNAVYEDWSGDGGGEYTALSSAAGGGHAEVVRLLLDAGADAASDTWNAFCLTALGHAINGGHDEIVGMMLIAGASLPNASDLRNDDKRCPAAATFVAAARGGFSNIVKRLLQLGFPPDIGAGYKSGETAIRTASSAGHLDIVKLLVEARADVNTRFFCSTPLSTAAREGHAHIVEFLISAGADINAPNDCSDSEKALGEARKAGHDSIVEMLKRAGARE